MPGRIPRIPLPRRAAASTSAPPSASTVNSPSNAPARHPSPSPSTPTPAAPSKPPRPPWTYRPSSSAPQRRTPPAQSPFRVPPPPAPLDPRKDPALRPPRRAPTPAGIAAHRARLRARYPAGWAPRTKMSREAMAALRLFHREDPAQFSVPMLADKFTISPEAVRRILRSRWEPGERRLEKMRRREERDAQAEAERRARDKQERREEARLRVLQHKALAAAGRAVRALGGNPLLRRAEDEEEGEEEEEAEEREVEVVRRERRSNKVTLEDRLLAARLRAAKEAKELAMGGPAPAPERAAALTADDFVTSTPRPGPSAHEPRPPASRARGTAPARSAPTPGPTTAPTPPTASLAVPLPRHIPDLSHDLPALLADPATPTLPALRAALQTDLSAQRFPRLGIDGVRRARPDVKQPARAGAGEGLLPGSHGGLSPGWRGGRAERAAGAPRAAEQRQPEGGEAPQYEQQERTGSQRPAPAPAQEAPALAEQRAGSHILVSPTAGGTARMRAIIEQRQQARRRREESLKDADKLLRGRMGDLPHSA